MDERYSVAELTISDNYKVEKYYYFINDIDKKVLETLKKGQSFTDKLMEKNYE